MHLGVDSFVSAVTDPRTGEVVTAGRRIGQLLDEMQLADFVGLHSYGIGEHHPARRAPPPWRGDGPNSGSRDVKRDDVQQSVGSRTEGRPSEQLTDAHLPWSTHWRGRARCHRGSGKPRLR